MSENPLKKGPAEMVGGFLFSCILIVSGCNSLPGRQSQDKFIDLRAMGNVVEVKGEVIDLRGNGQLQLNDTVEHITDQGILAKIAVEAQGWVVRWRAVERLSNQSLLAQIALEDKDDTVRQAALARVTDESILAKITADRRGSAEQDTAAAQRNLEPVIIFRGSAPPEGVNVNRSISDVLRGR